MRNSYIRRGVLLATLLTDATFTLAQFGVAAADDGAQRLAQVAAAGGSGAGGMSSGSGKTGRSAAAAAPAAAGVLLRLSREGAEPDAERSGAGKAVSRTSGPLWRTAQNFGDSLKSRPSVHALAR